MVDNAARIAACVDIFVIIARTDAVAVGGLDSAIDRAGQYHATGADVLFVEAVRTGEEAAAVARTFPDVPLRRPGLCDRYSPRSRRRARPPQPCQACRRSASSSTSSACPRSGPPRSAMPQGASEPSRLSRPVLDYHSFGRAPGVVGDGRHAPDRSRARYPGKVTRKRLAMKRRRREAAPAPARVIEHPRPLAGVTLEPDPASPVCHHVVVEDGQACWQSHPMPLPAIPVQQAPGLAAAIPCERVVAPHVPWPKRDVHVGELQPPGRRPDAWEPDRAP
jgi:Phosphoenolpyruvate phosphomutase